MRCLDASFRYDFVGIRGPNLGDAAWIPALRLRKGAVNWRRIHDTSVLETDKLGVETQRIFGTTIMLKQRIMLDIWYGRVF